MKEETLGDAPIGMDQADWERRVIDRAIDLARFYGRWRSSLGANDALKRAKDEIRADYELQHSQAIKGR